MRKGRYSRPTAWTSAYMPFYDCGGFPGTAQPWNTNAITFFNTQLWDSRGANSPNFLPTNYPHSGRPYSGTIYDFNNHALNCNFAVATGNFGSYLMLLGY